MEFIQKNKLRFICLLFIILYSPFSFARSNLTYEVQGIECQLLENANARLLAMQRPYGENLTPSQVFFLFKKGPQEIKKALQPFGYFQAKVYARLTKENTQWKAIYYICLGPPLCITHVRIHLSGPGEKNPVIWNFICRHAIKAREQFNTQRYNSFKTQLFQAAKNEGYLRAYYENKIRIDIRHNTADIDMHLFTGPRFYFGPIRFKTFPYSIEFMRRFFCLRPTEIFSSSRLLDLQQQLERSYFFRRVIFKLDFEHANNLQVPIDAYLYPPSSESFGLGIGYGTLTGARISGNMSLRHLGNEGHHLEAELKLSRVLSGAGVTYYIPGQNPLTDEWLMGANYKRFHPKAGRSNSFTLTAGFSKKCKNFKTSLTLNYLQEKFLIFTDKSWRSSHLLYPSWKTSFVRVDDLTAPKNGMAADLIVQGASDSVLSSTSFGSIQSRLKVMLSPFGCSRFLFRADAGAIGVHNLKVFPMSLRFFAGGINSIRGFADSSIGPGKYLGVASLEYQQNLKGNLYGAIFYDIGNASNHSLYPLNRGVGVGAVYDTRVGPIKIYLARAISKKTKPYSVEVSVGPEFS